MATISSAFQMRPLVYPSPSNDTIIDLNEPYIVGNSEELTDLGHSHLPTKTKNVQ
jgi:hypothetical protein